MRSSRATAVKEFRPEVFWLMPYWCSAFWRNRIHKKNSYCSFLINWQLANTINLPTQWKVPLRTLQQQRSRENLESKSIEKPQRSVFQEKKTNIAHRTWKVAKDVDIEKREKLVFSWDKAGCDWVTVKIPVRCRRFKERKKLSSDTF